MLQQNTYYLIYFDISLELLQNFYMWVFFMRFYNSSQYRNTTLISPKIQTRNTCYNKCIRIIVYCKIFMYNFECIKLKDLIFPTHTRTNYILIRIFSETEQLQSV